MQLYEILSKLTELEHKVSSLTYNNYGNNSLSPIIYKLEQIKDAIANVGNQTQPSQPSQPSQPITGLDDIINRIVTLENKIDKDTIYDDTELKSEIASIKAQIQSLNTQGYDDTDIKSRLDVLENKADNDTIYDDTEIQNEITLIKEQLLALNTQGYDDTELKTRVTNLEYNDVKYTDFDENRKTIQLDNHNTISGLDTTGAGHNLVMLSKWDVADFGAKGVHFNLNTKDTVTINDSSVVATLDDVEANKYDDTEIKKDIEDLQIESGEHGVRLSILEAKQDNDTIYDDTDIKSRLELLESMIFDIDVEAPVRDDMGEEFDNNQALVKFDYSFGNNTLTVSGPFADLFEYNSSNPAQGNGKWIGVGIKTGQELTNISVDGNMLTDQDKLEAKANGLSDDAFIFWFKAEVNYSRDLILRNKYFEKTITIKFKDIVYDV